MSVARVRTTTLRRFLWMTWGAIALVSCHGDIRFDELSTCALDADCALPSLHCNAGQCVACVTDAHCTAPGYPRCDLALHRCVECGVSADCSNAGLCRGGRCKIPCSAGCPASAPACDDSVCGQCDDGVGCAGSPAGPVCVAHMCAACKDDTTCGGATPRCDPVTNDCVQCRLNTDCPSARPLCDLTVGTCVALR